MKAAEKDKEALAASNDLDAVAGNAEDDIGDTIANIREKELLYGEKSLLRKYGRMIAAICANPRRYRVSPLLSPSIHARGKSLIFVVPVTETGSYTRTHQADVCLWTIL